MSTCIELRRLERTSSRGSRPVRGGLSDEQTDKHNGEENEQHAGGEQAGEGSECVPSAGHETAEQAEHKSSQIQHGGRCPDDDESCECRSIGAEFVDAASGGGQLQEHLPKCCIPDDGKDGQAQSSPRDRMVCFRCGP